MTKQEEIREGMIGQITVTLIYYKELIANKQFNDMEGLDKRLADTLLAYLHSQGCVIRVDRELPSIKEVFPLGGVPKEFTKGLEYYRCFLMGTDYVAVEPII